MKRLSIRLGTFCRGPSSYSFFIFISWDPESKPEADNEAKGDVVEKKGEGEGGVGAGVKGRELNPKAGNKAVREVVEKKGEGAGGGLGLNP